MASTTLLASVNAVSKEVGDYWQGTTTAAGSSTTVVDDALKAKTSDWITDEAYDFIISATCLNEERKISNHTTSGTLTVLAHTGTGPGTGATYQVHRLWSASDKRTACVEAAKEAYPSIYKVIRDENLVVGNWLRNGSAEKWALTTVPDGWVTDTCTQTQNTTKTYITVGSSSAKITGAAGGTYQSTTENSELWDLAGEAVTFKVDVWCDTASKARLRLYDGTTTTNGSYHTGGSVMEELTVTATMASSCSSIVITIRNETATGNIYWDNASAIGPTYNKIYVGDLGLTNNEPHQILQQSTSNLKSEPWQMLRGWEPDILNGYIHLTEGSNEYRLRVIGMGTLDFVTSAGVASTGWTTATTIPIGEPHIRILTAYAALYLYQHMTLPNYDSGTVTMFEAGVQRWQAEIAKRSALFGMPSPAATRDWGAMASTSRTLLRQVES